MHRINTISLCTALTSACFIAPAQNQTLETGTVTYGAGIHVGYVTVAEPAFKSSHSIEFSGGFKFDGSLLHRILLNKVDRTYFGYDLVVEPIGGTTQCRVMIEPLSLTLSELMKETGRWRTSIDSSWKPATLPRYPAPQVVDAGDTIALDLLVNPDGRQKIVDYIHASCQKTEPSRVTDSEPPRDFNLEDVELHISTGSLYENGVSVSGTPTVGEASGPIVWFYYPGKGRFIVSVAPRDGYDFRKAGVIRGNRLSFKMDGTEYEVRGTHPILASGRAWNVYVLFDSSYRPKRPDMAAFGSAARIEDVDLTR